MNDKQQTLLLAAAELAVNNPCTLRALGERCWPGDGRSYSWARNSVRGPVSDGVLRRAGRGSVQVAPYTADPDTLKALRGSQSQSAFAKVLGIPRGRVAHWEQGRAQPGFAQVVAIAVATETPVTEVVAFEEQS